MRAIVLAAGQGTRMSPLTDHTPKSLLPIGDSTVLVRLVGQILDRGADDVSVVVGYEKERVGGAITEAYGDRVRIVENNGYLNDVNILSLGLAVGDDPRPFTVFEADCLFDDVSMDKVFDPAMVDFSSWYTIGPFQPYQVGGILQSDVDHNVSDVRVVPKYEDRYKGYQKLVGLLKVGPGEVERYVKLLHSEVDRNTKQYYLAPWINNLGALPCRETPLGDHHVGAFNTPDEYNNVLKMFGEECISV